MTPEEVAVDVGRLERARHWVDVHQPGRALEELDQLHGALAVSLDAALLRTVANLHADQPDRALRTAAQALGAHGPSPQLNYLLAHAYRGLGDERGAEEALLQGLELDPFHPDLLCLYAELCLHDGQLSKAQELWARAAEVAPEADSVMRGRILLRHALGRSNEATALVREYLGRDPENPDAWALRTMLAADRGDVAQAYSSSRRLVTGDPGNKAFVDAAIELRVAAHPALVPLRPFMRINPGAVWVGQVVIVLIAVSSSNPVVSRGVPAIIGSFVIYSWIAPPLVRRWVRWRTR